MDIPTKKLRFQSFLGRLFRHHFFIYLNTFYLEFKHFWYRILEKVRRYRRSFDGTGFASKSTNQFWGTNSTCPPRFRRPCLCILILRVVKFSRDGYKIRQILGHKLTQSKETKIFSKQKQCRVCQKSFQKIKVFENSGFFCTF